MLQERLKWNEKYQSQSYPDQPSAVVKKFANLAKGKKALDIAAGNGRNALFLAHLGFSVDAVDISDAGLKLFANRHPTIHPICADLDDFEIPSHRYDLIINIKYLNRRLFPYIHEGLVPGGVLIFQTFLDSSNLEADQPASQEYRLGENELLHAFLSLRIIHYVESEKKKNGETACLASLIGIKFS